MNSNKLAPESTAERVALWRALHTEVEQAPWIFEDRVGLALLDDPPHWRERPDMNPEWTANFRASIVARARFIEDYLESQIVQGVQQYVILGAGLDSFAQRHPELLKQIDVYEVDQARPQQWKIQRLKALNYDLPERLHFVGVDFEQGWWDELVQAGFQPNQPAVVVSTGVTMYLSLDANTEMFTRMTHLAPGSSFITTYILPVELVEPEHRAGLEASMQGAAKSGHPFISLFRPEQMEALLKQVGFSNIQQVPSSWLKQQYFQNRTDGFTLSSGEEIIIGKIEST